MKLSAGFYTAVYFWLLWDASTAFEKETEGDLVSKNRSTMMYAEFHAVSLVAMPVCLASRFFLRADLMRRHSTIAISNSIP
jgi:hypothetical protein